jgi:acetyl-CoA C-acetyltransferase
MSTTLRLSNIPVTHVENMCASGTEAFRGACYAVASGAADIAIALGVEKLKDTGYGGLPGGRGGPLQALWSANGTAPGNFAQLATAYMTAHGVSGEDLKKAIGHVSWKSHQNGAKNPKAHLQKAVEMETILNAPMIASPLGLFDCCGVSDGAAAAIVTTPEIAKALGKHDIVSVKALQLSVSNGSESGHNSWDGSYFHTTRIASKKAYEEAGIKSPRDEVSMFEVHDCFSVTELVTMEDLHISETARAGRTCSTASTTPTARSPARSTGASSASAIRSAPRACACSTRCTCSSRARRVLASSRNPRIGMTHNLGRRAPRENISRRSPSSAATSTPP